MEEFIKAHTGRPTYLVRLVEERDQWPNPISINSPGLIQFTMDSFEDKMRFSPSNTLNNKAIDALVKAILGLPPMKPGVSGQN